MMKDNFNITFSLTGIKIKIAIFVHNLKQTLSLLSDTSLRITFTTYFV